MDKSITIHFWVLSLWMVSVFAISGNARTSSDDKVYTLSELLLIAEKKSDQVRIIDEEYAAGRQQVRFYRSEAYPQVSFSAGGGISSQSMSGLTQYGSPGGGAGIQGQAPGDDPTEPQQVVAPIPPERSTAYAMQWSLSAQQPLITFGRVRNALKLAGMQDSVLEGSRRLQKDYLYLSVMEAFSTAYLADKQVGIAQKSLASAQRLLDRMTVEVQSGAGSKLDYLRVQSQAEAARADHLMAISNREIAYRRLSQSVGLGIDTGYAIAYTAADSLFDISRPESGYSTEYTLKGLQAQMRETQGEYERSGLYPSIYLLGSIDNSVQILTDDFYETLNQDETDIAMPDKFNYTIGLQLQWNLFDGFRTPAARAQALAESRKARAEQKQLGEQNEIALQESRERLQVLSQSMDAVNSQLAAARRAFELVEDDYTRGYVDISDYLETEKNLREAEKRLYELQMQRLLTIGQLRMNLGVPVYEGK